MAKKKASGTTKKSTPRKSSSRKKTPPKGKSALGGGVDFAAVAQGLGNAWQESREKEPQAAGFAPPDVPDGDYVVQLTSGRVGQYRSGNKKGTGYVKFRYTIATGDYEGEVLSSTDDLSTDEVGSSGRTKLDLLSERLQRMGVDTKKLNLAELPELVVWLTDVKKNKDAKPYYRVTVRNNFVESDSGETLHFQNVYVNDILHPDDVAEL